jgi:hypothetical protein
VGARLLIRNGFGVEATLANCRGARPLGGDRAASAGGGIKSADSGTIEALAVPLKRAFHIGNTEVAARPFRGAIGLSADIGHRLNGALDPPASSLSGRQQRKQGFLMVQT